MTTAVLITNPSPDSTRALEFRANNPGAQGFESPWSTVLPGLSACILVEGAEQIEVREGGPIPDGYVAPRPGVLEVRRTDEVTELDISDDEIIVINGIRFQGVAFRYLAEDANVGKVFRLDSNADGVVQVTEVLLVPAKTDDERAIDGVVDSSPVVDSGPGETLPGAAMIAEVPTTFIAGDPIYDETGAIVGYKAEPAPPSDPDLTIHPDTDAPSAP